MVFPATNPRLLHLEETRGAFTFRGQTRFKPLNKSFYKLQYVGHPKHLVLELALSQDHYYALLALFLDKRLPKLFGGEPRSREHHAKSLKCGGKPDLGGQRT